MIPECLEKMEPGVELAAYLTCIDVERLSGYDKIVVLQAHQRMASHYAAQTYKAMASLVESMDDAEDDPANAAQAAATEVRAAMRLTRRAADSEMCFALDFRRLRQVWSALNAGLIDLRKARLIARLTSQLPEGAACAVVDQIMEEAAQLTTGQLQVRLRRLCLAVDPEDAALRYEDAVAQRRVVMEPTVDGTAHVMGLDLPPDRVAAVIRRINELARGLKTGGEGRTMDQLRADVLLDVLEGDRSFGAGAVVDIRVDLDTLACLADTPGDVSGYGPVVADIARRVVSGQRSSQWRFTVTDPDSGEAVAAGTTRRRPTSAQRREVHARYPTCVFPGCRMPAAECDLDHRDPWAEGGSTTTCNLAPLCRHDHMNRHQRGWSYERIDRGDHQWTSPLGRRYTTSGRPP